MAYDINKTDGTRVVIVPDRTIKTVAGLRLLGKNYSSYGEIMAENLVQMLEHHASYDLPTAPGNPLEGQIWFDKKTQSLNVYTNESRWVPFGGLHIGNSTGIDLSPIKGTDSDPNIDSTFHQAIRIKVKGQVVAIISQDSYIPHPDTGLQTAFPLIGKGINLNQTGTDDDLEAGDYKFRGRSMEAEFADMAEIYRSDMELVPGNLIKLGGHKEITKTTAEYDDGIFGIISTQPGFLLNSKAKLEENAYPVALKGRVPCIVKGPVRQGQRIVASDIAGVGMGVDRADLNAVIGRAISTKESDKIGTVEVAVGVK
jgi:hypothetical protein